MKKRYNLVFTVNGNATKFTNKTLSQVKQLILGRKSANVDVRTSEMFFHTYSLQVDNANGIVTVKRFTSGHPRPDLLAVYYRNDNLQATFYPQSQSSFEISTLLLLPYIMGMADNV
jgi:hypothetical protein